MIGTSKSLANKADNSLSAIPAPFIRFKKDGVTNTMPTFDFASPLSIL
jgi:hypothetical protein